MAANLPICLATCAAILYTALDAWQIQERWAKMDISTPVEFPDTEEAYCAWVQRYPFDFVINAWKDPTREKDNAMMWHRADCDTINPKYSSSEPPLHYVIGDRLKACSANPAALAMWAKDRTEPLTYCEECYSMWQKEQPSVS